MAESFSLPHDAKMRINMLLEMQKKKRAAEAADVTGSRIRVRGESAGLCSPEAGKKLPH